MKNSIKILLFGFLCLWFQIGYCFDYEQTRTEIVSINNDLRSKISVQSSSTKKKYTKLLSLSLDIDSQLNNGDWDQMRGLFVVLKSTKKNIADRRILADVNGLLEAFNSFSELKLLLSNQVDELVSQIDNLLLKANTQETNDILTSWKSQLLEIQHEINSNYLSSGPIESLRDEFKILVAETVPSLTSRQFGMNRVFEIKKILNQIAQFQAGL